MVILAFINLPILLPTQLLLLLSMSIALSLSTSDEIIFKFLSVTLLDLRRATCCRAGIALGFAARIISGLYPSTIFPLSSILYLPLPLFPSLLILVILITRCPSPPS